MFLEIAMLCPTCSHPACITRVLVSADAHLRLEGVCDPCELSLSRTLDALEAAASVALHTRSIDFQRGNIEATI